MAGAGSSEEMKCRQRPASEQPLRRSMIHHGLMLVGSWARRNADTLRGGFGEAVAQQAEAARARRRRQGA
jgi:hypothetical protein